VKVFIVIDWRAPLRISIQYSRFVTAGNIDNACGYIYTYVTRAVTPDIVTRDYGQNNAELNRPGEAAAETTEEGSRSDTLKDPAGQAEIGRSCFQIRPQSLG